MLTDDHLTTTRQVCTGISRAKWLSSGGILSVDFASAKGADGALQKKEEWKKKSGTRTEH